MKNLIKKLVLLSLFVCALPSYSWNATGHKIIAAIAYENLTPSARLKVDQLTLLLDPDYPAQARFIYAATVADKMREQGDDTKDALHFINLPWSKDGTATQPPNKKNLVWAVNYYHAQLTQTNDPRAQALGLNYVLHFVGDIHQPLHCINQFSKDFPNGDLGGNRFKIPLSYAKNLHALWDQGAGLFKSSQRFDTRKIFNIAEKITQQYPQSQFATELKEASAQTWAEECHQLAIDYAYNTLPGAKPSKAYLQQSREIVDQQLALAGYRLAALLNGVY